LATAIAVEAAVAQQPWYVWVNQMTAAWALRFKSPCSHFKGV